MTEIAATVSARLAGYAKVAQARGLDTRIQPVENIPGAAELIVTGHLGAWLQVIVRPSAFKSKTSVYAQAASFAGGKASKIPAGRIATHIAVMTPATAATAAAPAIEVAAPVADDVDWYVVPEGTRFNVATRKGGYVESTCDTLVAAQLEADQRNLGIHWSQQKFPEPTVNTWAGHGRPTRFRYYGLLSTSPEMPLTHGPVVEAAWFPGGDVELSNGKTLSATTRIWAAPLEIGAQLSDGTRYGVDTPVEAAPAPRRRPDPWPTTNQEARESDVDWGLGRPAGHPDDTQLDLLAELESPAIADQLPPRCPAIDTATDARCFEFAGHTARGIRHQNSRWVTGPGNWTIDGKPANWPDRLIVIPCGALKADHATAASDMYVGSYHRAARRAADALSAAGDDPATIVILSAKHGLLELDAVIEPYELRLGDPDAITSEELADMAYALCLDEIEDVTILAGKAYGDLAAAVWPHAKRPLIGSRGMGDQLALFATIVRTGEIPAPFTPAAPSPAPSQDGPYRQGATVTPESEWTFRSGCNHADCDWPGTEFRARHSAVGDADGHAIRQHSAPLSGAAAFTAAQEAAADDPESPLTDLLADLPGRETHVMTTAQLERAAALGRALEARLELCGRPTTYPTAAAYAHLDDDMAAADAAEAALVDGETESLTGYWQRRATELAALPRTRETCGYPNDTEDAHDHDACVDALVEAEQNAPIDAGITLTDDQLAALLGPAGAWLGKTVEFNACDARLAGALDVGNGLDPAVLLTGPVVGVEGGELIVRARFHQTEFAVHPEHVRAAHS